MSNADTGATWIYHDGTKHSPESVRRSRHVLDWDIMPRPFKVYVDLVPLRLPRDFTVSTQGALEALSHAGRGEHGGALDLTALARLLHFSAGVVRHRKYPGGEVFYRAAACTGALYHIDVYVVAGPLTDLDAGVYHFDPHDFSLRRLRTGDHRGVLVHASGNAPTIAAAPVTLVCASTYWRNSWKYQARTYRHCFWDDGTLTANLLAVANAADVPAHLTLGFVDTDVNRLLDLDDQREVALSLVALGEGAASPPDAPTVAPLGLATLPLSLTEVDYPAIRAMHAASSLATSEAATAWRAAATASTTPAPATTNALQPSNESIEAVILRRGSARRFKLEPIEREQLMTILRAATADIDADYGQGGALTQVYAIVNSVAGLAAGTYAYDRATDALAQLRAGEIRNEAGFLALGQDLAHDAAVNLYWLVDLPPLLARFGNRGYRAAQMDAAIGGGRTYLASYALGLRATGLTFFDDQVTELFSPPAAGKSVMFLMAVGR